jgi:hypothetical protein
MHASKDKLRSIVLTPVLAAAATFSIPACTEDLPNNGVPGVDMNVSSRDQGTQTDNGVPGVDVSVSSRDRGSTQDKGVPGVDADVSSGNRASGERNGVPGADLDIAARQPTADTGTRGMGASGPQDARGPRTDRN